MFKVSTPNQGQCFFLTGIGSYSGYEFVFPVRNASAKTIICGLSGIPRGIASDQVTYFKAKKCDSRPTIMEATDLTVLPTTLKQLA